ncbi:MAG: 3-dehydroquinate synthase [Proteobacteria bacterium]|nr:3-dehydroquinate synthase [Pseudomonadota bacterium]
MEVIEVQTRSRNYPVYIGQGILNNPALWSQLVNGRRLLIVSNEIVAPLYLDTLCKALPAGGQHEQLILPDGEEYKTIDQWMRVSDKLADMKAGRDACIIALGGGVIGDLAGFAAASWMRGIDIIQVPTTLLAQVDASVGGKTAINHVAGKNLLGAFHQPRAVIIDCETLNTLPTREYRAGLAEVIKYGAIGDSNFFNWLEQQADSLNARLPESILQAVITSVNAKADVVAADELEQGQRALLNFGHTFAHAIETATEYKLWLHGEAVAIGMILAARLGTQLGLDTGEAEQRLTRLCAALGLPGAESQLPPAGELIEHMRLDKKNLGGQYRFILLKTLGQAFIHTEITDADLSAVLTG